MKAVALTGGIASGKTTVRHQFETMGIQTICTDELAREVVQPNTYGLRQIVDHFSSAVLTNEGYLNRKKLNQIIFNDPDERKWLENLLHPLIRQLLQTRIASHTSAYTLVDIPLLAKEKLPYYPFINAVVVVDISFETQIDRLCQRDHLSYEQAQKRINTQISREERRQIADFIIDNDNPERSLIQQIKTIHHQLLAMFHHE